MDVILQPITSQSIRVTWKVRFKQAENTKKKTFVMNQMFLKGLY